MTLPVGSIRPAVVARLVDLWGRRTDVPTSFGLPRKIAREQVFVSAVETLDLGIPTMRAGRKHRQDDFVVTMMIMVARPGQSATVVAERVDEIVTALDDILADDPQIETIEGLQWCSLADYSGPVPYATPEGYAGDATVAVECHTRLN